MLIKPKDITTVSSKSNGQWSVSITHRKTGIVAECNTFRGKKQNQKQAMVDLNSKLDSGDLNTPYK